MGTLSGGSNREKRGGVMSEKPDLTHQQRTGKAVGIGCLGLVVLILLIVMVSCAIGGHKDEADQAVVATAATPAEADAFAADMIGWNGIMARCDNATKTAQKQLGRRDRYAAYDAVTQASETCRAASESLSLFKFSDTIGAARIRKLDQMKVPCVAALSTRSSHLGEAAKVINGDESPKQVKDAADVAAYASEQMAKCVVAVADAKASAGFQGAHE